MTPGRDWMDPQVPSPISIPIRKLFVGNMAITLYPVMHNPNRDPIATGI